VHDDHGMLAAHVVEEGTVHHSHPRSPLVESLRDEPLTRRYGGNPRPQGFPHVIRPVRRCEIDPYPGERRLRRVTVRVVEAGDHERAVEVDPFSAGKPGEHSAREPAATIHSPRVANASGSVPSSARIRRPVKTRTCSSDAGRSSWLCWFTVRPSGIEDLPTRAAAVVARRHPGRRRPLRGAACESRSPW
jgi:hypothetical protein